MASDLLRASARRGSTFHRFVSVARSGGEGLASRCLASLPRYSPRRLSHSATPDGQLPTCPDEKLNALLEKIRVTGSTSLENPVVLEIFTSSMLAREEYYSKQLERSWLTSSVLISGGIIGYYIRKSQKENNRGGSGN